MQKKIEVLVATMYRTNTSLYNEMNLHTDAVIINQCDRFERTVSTINGNELKFYSFNERGVGRSRNHALMNSSADICMLADEDMIYVDGYEKIVLRAFKKNPKADIILFEIESLNPERKCAVIKKNARITLFNGLKYGACRIAFKREKVIRSNIWFSLMFGGGAKYGSGEDSLFIYECIKKGLKLYTCKEKILDVKQDTSSWFTGYGEKYYKDKGALFAAMTPRYSKLLSVIFAAKWYQKYKSNYKFTQIVKLMFDGVDDYMQKYNACKIRVKLVY